jgi:uncharacterized membrane protein YfhO
MRILTAIKKHPLTLAFCLPVIVMAVYFFAVRHVYPFGNASLLTVDMGQQYVDFYSYFRQTLLGHPGQLFYAWNKALGGDMFGVWAYYLMSPFNLLLLLFPKTQIDLAITAMTLVKYGAASLSMAYFMYRRGRRGLILPTTGFAYALCGWMVANTLNLMWLDGAIILPLVADGIERLSSERPRHYALWLAAALIANYYMGYMICLFAILYYLYVLVRDWQGKRQAGRVTLRFTAGSLLAGGLAAVVLLPTFYQLSQSKGTYTVTKISSRFEYNPLHLIAKFFSGAFNFDQMPSGTPNIFIGALLTLGVILFFIARNIPLRERLTALLVTAFLVVSMMYEPLDLLWHGMQFPVWYPYRFSFVVCFFLIVVGERGLRSVPDGINVWKMLLLTALALAATIYVWLHLKSFSFLSRESVILSGLYALLAIVILSAKNDQLGLSHFIIFGFTIIDLTTSAALALNQISYVTHSDFHSYTETLRAGVNKIQAADHGTYRIAKTVLRTKNDAMQIGYMGEDQFNSMFEPAIPRFYAAIGQPEGDGFVTYADGTLLSDALLDTKYWLGPRTVSKQALGNTLLPGLSSRPDMSEYDYQGHTKLLNIYKNQNALGLAFAASSHVQKTKLNSTNPLTNQEAIIAGLMGRDFESLFNVLPFDQTMLTNIKVTNDSNGPVYHVKKGHKRAQVTYTYTPKTSDPLYLIVGSDFTDNAVDVSLNGNKVITYDTFRSPVILNVSPDQVGKKQTIKMTFSKSINFSDVFLYSLNKAQLTADLHTLKQNGLSNVQRSDTSLSGDITTDKDQNLIFTTVPAANGWHIRLDGKPVKPVKVLDTFWAIKTKPGHHHLQMCYTPPYLLLGLAITAISGLGAACYLIPRHRHKHTVRHKA